MPSPETQASGSTPAASRVLVARLGAVRGGSVPEWVDVHFNPASLQLQVSNELKDTRNNERKQYIAKTNAKLTMELLFDTTHSGEDVTNTTRKIQAFIIPPGRQGRRPPRQQPPPLVAFEWGRMKFKGIAESYKETLDFFSADGIPLRASVNLTLSRQDEVFDNSPGGGAEDVGQSAMPRELGTAGSAADAANASGEPWAARFVASANGQESLRFGSGSPLTVDDQVQLRPPIAFTAGGAAGLGLSAGIGATSGAGAGISAAVGVGGAGAGVSIGLTAGVSGLARLSATDGAFAALKVTPPAGPSTPRLDPSAFAATARSSASLSTDHDATFRVGGRASVQGPAGLRTDVGLGGGLRGKLTFEG